MHKSFISLLACIFEIVADSTFKILPFSGKIACVSLLLACFADPPAESPSTIKISVSSDPLREQSASLPGSRNFFVAVLRRTSLAFLLFTRSSARSIAHSNNLEASLGELASQ